MSCIYPAKCFGQICILKGCLKWTVLHEVYLHDASPYTGCPRRNVKYFGRVFLMLNYTDITQNTYNQS